MDCRKEGDVKPDQADATKYYHLVPSTTVQIPASDFHGDFPETSTNASDSTAKKYSDMTEQPRLSETPTPFEVEFHVGKDRQLMIGSRSELASISPVFKSLFCQPTTMKQTVVEIPDIQTPSFGVILRCAARDSDLHLTDDTVWGVLQAASHFQVLPVVTLCFHFLLHKHSQRHKSRHLCQVLEKTHRLQYKEHHAKCLLRVKRQANKIFKSTTALSELCHQCMLKLVMADDLHNVSEVLVHDAVVTWARGACKRQYDAIGEPSWEDLRVIAGQMVYYVRYLAMPRHTLQSLRAGEPSCLLSEKEKLDLLERNGSNFPPQVNIKRRGKGFDKKKLWDLVLASKQRMAFACMAVVFILILLVFLVVYLYSPPDLATVISSPQDSPTYVLVIQEE